MNTETPKPLVFLVEDNAFFAQTVALGLTNKGLNIEWMSTGESLLNKLKTASPDIIVLDYHLDDSKENALTGGNYLEIIKAMYPRIPVLMLTALTDTREAVKLLKKGAVDFIPKDDQFFDNLLKSLESIFQARELSHDLENSRNQIKRLNRRLFTVITTVTVAMTALVVLYKYL